MKKRNARRMISLLILAVLIAVPVFAFASDNALVIDLPLKKGDTGVAVAIVQTRLMELGYLHFSATGKYGDMTVSAVRRFQSRNGLPVDGALGEDTYLAIFSMGAVRGGRSAAITSFHGKGQIASVAYGMLFDWKKDVDSAFPVGDTVTLTDYNTGTELSVTRTGGVNHADIRVNNEPALLDILGGGNSWEKRAAVVTIGEMRIAASLFGYPNSDGSYCLYFSGSRSDVGGGLADAEHEAMLIRANGQ